MGTQEEVTTALRARKQAKKAPKRLRRGCLDGGAAAAILGTAAAAGLAEGPESGTAAAGGAGSSGSLAGLAGPSEGPARVPAAADDPAAATIALLEQQLAQLREMRRETDPDAGTLVRILLSLHQ